MKLIGNATATPNFVNRDDKRVQLDIDMRRSMKIGANPSLISRNS